MPGNVRREFESFNPRTREGATNDALDDIEVSGVSIHAPVRVRPKTMGESLHIKWFQSTHP